jgi:hypothetical protein
MDKHTKAIYLAPFAGLATFTVACSIVNFVAERKIRKQIQSDLDKDLATMRAAAMQVQENIQRGKYDGIDMEAMMTDFEFARIMLRMQE